MGIQMNEGAVSVEIARAGAEVQAAMAIARQFPRKPSDVLQRVKLLCQDPVFADRAAWRFKRGGDMISGPSIHLVKALADAYGNLRYGVAQLSRDVESVGCEVRVYCMDLETNVECAMTFWASSEAYVGGRDLRTARDRYENMANQASRRLREMILGCLPANLVESARKQCRATLENTETPLQKTFRAFAEHGVTEGDLTTFLGMAAKEWGTEQREHLAGIYGALRDGAAEPADYFTRHQKSELQARLAAVELHDTAEASPVESASSETVAVDPTSSDVALLDNAPTIGTHEATCIRFSEWRRIPNGWAGKWAGEEHEGTVSVSDDGLIAQFTPSEAPASPLREAVRWALGQQG